MELIISGNNKKYLAQVEKLARRLGLSIRKSENTHGGLSESDRTEALYELMTQKSDSGGLESIHNLSYYKR